MNLVLDKLTERKNRSSPADEIFMLTEKLKQDLLGVKEDFCDKVAGQPVMHKQVKVCMKQVRELVFSIEDWIDTELKTDLVVDPRPKFDYFKAKIHRARERFTTYFDLHKPVPTEADAATTKITINPRLLLEEKSCPGLFDGAKHQLVKYLTDEMEDMRRVVSVVGREGLGKTTLAKEIYSELKLYQLFQCQAFVSVGRTTPTREVLDNILSQVKPTRYEIRGSIVSDVHEIITQLQEYLATKRYLQLHIFFVVSSLKCIPWLS
jgi:disease resistance protein RPM1